MPEACPPACRPTPTYTTYFELTFLSNIHTFFIFFIGFLRDIADAVSNPDSRVTPANLEEKFAQLLKLTDYLQYSGQPIGCFL
jgi:hypothetical protein